ncbi:GIY-YIG nuclease family protein [Candidatus Binatia bacterium]|nr:GIY-YIG nuclease family protein [Candidatus Binatia bacterium]
MVFSLGELASNSGKVPGIPGVYVFRGADGRALYVGKSRNLRARLASYFQPTADRLRKVRALRRSAATVTIEPTGSDFAALLREIALVQALAPPLNKRLRRHERYSYLAVDYRETFPRLTVTPAPADGVRALGPFNPQARVGDAVAIVSDAFRLRTCDDPQTPGAWAHCFRLQLHACSAPCLGRVTPGDYGRDFLRAVLALSARSKAALAGLIAERNELAAAERFEEAARRQRIIEGIETIRRRLFINRVWRNAAIAVQPGAGPGTIRLWGIAGSKVCDEVAVPLGELTPALDRLVEGLEEAEDDALAPVAQDELDRRWVVFRWLRSAEGRRWSVGVAGLPPDALRARVAAMAREALGLFAGSRDRERSGDAEDMPPGCPATRLT